jgi:flavin reductase (DIM6/NTAB) family NADH-FMN oxidoreductase RutF
MIRRPHAKVAELADAQDSGSCGRKVVGVQVPPFAPFPSEARPEHPAPALGCPEEHDVAEGVAMDPASFRRAIGNFATGVTIVTTANGGRLHGVTANSLTSVSLDPLLLLVCVDKAAHAHAEMLACSSFGVSVLADDQKDLSNLFAKSALPEEGTLRGVAFRFGASGCPLIEGSIAHFECLPHQRVDAGDHTVFLGRVVAGGVGRPEADPLLYFRGGYRGISGT